MTNNNNLPQLLTFSTSLAEQFPKATDSLYESCHKNASRHTGEGSIFDLRPIDPNDPYQNIDTQVCQSDMSPVANSLALGDSLSPGLSNNVDIVLGKYRSTIKEMNSALKAGYNIALAVPTHEKVHDIAFPIGVIRGCLDQEFNNDKPNKWFEIFAKSLAWVELFGRPIPEYAQCLGNILFTLPHSKTGDLFNAEIKKEFNKRSLQQLYSRLDLGGHVVGFATAGSTNLSKKFKDHKTITMQGAIHPSTEKLMTNERNLVLPLACYFDEDEVMQMRVGKLQKLNNTEDCLNVGIWGATKYSEMSGQHVFQARNRQQAENFAKDKLEDILDELKTKKFVRWMLERYHSND